MKKHILLIAVIAMALCVPYGAHATAYSLSYGGGQAQIILFSDYFCPPCQMLEEGIEEALTALINSGQVRVTYIPVPTSSLSTGVTIHLLNQTMGRPYSQVLPVRKGLYARARAKRITKADVEQWVAEAKKGKNMPEIAANMQTIQGAINHYDVRSTPTCIIIAPNGQAMRYEGVREIGTAILDILSPGQR